MVRILYRYKKLTTTILISLLTILIVSFLSYIIYVHGFYDVINKNRIIENFNSFKFNKVFDDIYLKDNKYLTKDTFIYMTDIMFNKKNLEKIYDNYYKNNNKYKSKDDFIKKYYYGYKEVNKDSIIFDETGNNTFFTRKTIKSKSYEVTNGYKEKISLGVLENVLITTNNNSKIKIDGNTIDCNKICGLDNIYSGVHSIEYIKDGYTYYTLYLINNNNTSINLNNISTLVAVSEEVDMNIFDDIDIKNIDLNVGIYSLVKDNTTNSSILVNYSYIVLNNDKTFNYYVYTDINKEPNEYSGTYKIENAFLTLNYQLYRYYTYEEGNTVIHEELSSKMETFNIYNKNKFYNEFSEFELKK